MADEKISELPAATVSAGANEFAINEAGTSKKLTLDQVWNGLYAPGSFTVPTGSFRIMANRLVLTGTQTCTLEGDAILRIT